MSLYLLDFSAVSGLLRGTAPALRRALLEEPGRRMAISALTRAELAHEVARRSGDADLALRVEEFLMRVEVLAFDSDAAVAFGELKFQADLEDAEIDAGQLLVAAQAIALDAELITLTHWPDGLRRRVRVADIG